MAETPSIEHLLEVTKNPQFLYKDKNQYFDIMTAKFIFLSNWDRSDIFEAVEFLMTIVKGPDMDYYNKIFRVVKYLRGDPETHLTLEADNVHTIEWWIEASFSVQTYINIHTGSTMSMGRF